MAGRIAAESTVSVLLALVLVVSGVALVDITEGTASPLEALTVEAPRTVFGTVGIAIALWAALVVIGNVVNRRRAPGWKLLANGVSALVVALLNVVVWFAITVPQGGWALLLVAIVLLISAVFLVSAVLALWLTHFVLFPRPPGQTDRLAPA